MFSVSVALITEWHKLPTLQSTSRMDKIHVAVVRAPPKQTLNLPARRLGPRLSLCRTTLCMSIIRRLQPRRLILVHSTRIQNCMPASKHACMHAHIHTYVHTYIHTYIHSLAKLYGRMLSRTKGPTPLAVQVLISFEPFTVSRVVVDAVPSKQAQQQKRKQCQPPLPSRPTKHPYREHPQLNIELSIRRWTPCHVADLCSWAKHPGLRCKMVGQGRYKGKRPPTFNFLGPLCALTSPKL